jgi:hypothetical protein
LVCVTTDGNHETVCYECSRFCISLKLTRSTQKPCCIQAPSWCTYLFQICSIIQKPSSHLPLR